MLKPLIDLHGEPRNWVTSAPFYVAALSDIPPELLAKAVQHAVALNPFFPKPADLRASIADELEHRQWMRQDEAHRLAALPAPDRAPITAEDIEYVDNAVAEALQILAGRRAVIRGDIDVE